MRHTIGADLHVPEHAGPATEREQRCGKEVLPLLLIDAEGFERFTDRVERRDVLLSAHSRRQLAGPAARNGPAGAVEVDERPEEALFAPGERPGCQPLVGERGAE